METEMNFNAQKLMHSLSRLQSDMKFVREHIEDITLTEDDLKSIVEAKKDLREGRTISHQQLKKELGL
ncbi:MAG: hypothetical protein AABX65_00530 [Nanoarchaeota archaeon]